MVVVMEERATEEQVQSVVAHLVDMGIDVHRSTGALRTVLGAVGGSRKVDPRLIEVLDGVHEVLRITEPYKLASRTFKPEDTVITIGDVRIGGDEVIVMAGPCSAETEEQVQRPRPRCKRAGAKVLRGGAFKPRSSPYSFQGLGEEGLRMLRDAADRHDLKLVTEVMDISQIELIGRYADIFQVGARNMQNFTLLRELGHARKPVLLKRGISATIEEWLLSAEYILAGGNSDVILCERGIRTFETYTRNTLDISAIPVVKKLSHLPIFVDPSHGTGTARQGGADGARGGGGRRRRPDHRGAQRSGHGAERRRAVDVPRPVRSADGGAAHHRAGDRPQHLPRADGAPRLVRQDRMHREQQRDPERRVRAAVCHGRDRRRRPDRRIDRPGGARALAGVRVIGVDRRDVLREARRSARSTRRREALAGDRREPISSCWRRRWPEPRLLRELAAHVRRRRSSPTSAAPSARSSRPRGRCPGLVFVGGHPLAGAAGPASAPRGRHLFRGRPWILTPDGAPRGRGRAPRRFVPDLGARARASSTRTGTIAWWRSSAICRSSSPRVCCTTIGGAVGRAGSGAVRAGAGGHDAAGVEPAGHLDRDLQSNADHVEAAIDALIACLADLDEGIHSSEHVTTVFESAAGWRGELRHVGEPAWTGANEGRKRGGGRSEGANS